MVLLIMSVPAMVAFETLRVTVPARSVLPFATKCDAVFVPVPSVRSLPPVRFVFDVKLIGLPEIASALWLPLLFTFTPVLGAASDVVVIGPSTRLPDVSTPIVDDLLFSRIVSGDDVPVDVPTDSVFADPPEVPLSPVTWAPVKLI